jgi:hypothetical protein
VDPLALVGRGVSAGLRLGRGTADRALRVVGPQVARVAGLMTSRGRRQEPPTTSTFTPSKRPEPPVTTPVVDRAPEPVSPASPSPASVAHNIAPQRPTATPPKPQVKPKSVPGAKLPPPRPSAS